MTKIQIKEFRGIAPKTDARLLPDSYAQISDNLKLTSGSLQSWRDSISRDLPAKAGLLKTIYLYQDTGADRWLHWTTDVDVVRAPIANDTTHRIYFTGDGAPKGADNSNDTVTGIDGPAGNSEFPESSVTLGAPSPTAAPSVAIGSSGAGTNPTNHVYVYTFISQWGEESPPSPASAIISVDLLDGNVDISAMETTWGAQYNSLDKQRIYRSLSGTSGADFQFVAEIDPLSSTYTDSINDTSLGEIILSRDFDLPPTDLFGIMDIGNGIFVAFTKFEVCFTEPYQPHAWPIKYRLAIAQDIIGGGFFGNTIVVCTNGQPVLITGDHPLSMTVSISPDYQACVSKRGIVSMGGLVVFPTPNGLYGIGYSGSRLFTDHLYDGETWQERNPSQLRAVPWDTRYIGFTDTKGIMIETAEGKVSATDFNIVVDAVYVHQETDLMYICQTIDGVSDIREFNAAGTRVNYKWRSKKFSIGSQATITAGKVLAEYGALLSSGEIIALNQLIADITAANVTLLTGNVEGSLNSREVHSFYINSSLIVTPPSTPMVQGVVLKLFGDGVFLGTATAVSDLPFRLPSGKRSRQFEIEIEGFTIVNEITLASSISDLT